MIRNYIQNARGGSVSLRRIQTLMVVLALTVSGILLYFSFTSSDKSQMLTQATDQYISLHDAVDELMDASDYLTEMAQRFTAQGDRKYMNAYFEEAFTTRRRQHALETMGKYPGTEAAKAELQQALNESLSLMDREYYSMRLVVEAKGYTGYPEQLQQVVLNPEDESLSPAEQMDLARNMLLDEDYYAQKDRIRKSMGRSRDELTQSTQKDQLAVKTHLNRNLELVRVNILVQSVIFLLMIWITMRMGIHPVLTAVKSIQADRRIPVIGASEFRYLAQAYNKMYEYYHASIQRLNYKASHDELTKVYNRSGYELLLSTIDQNSTYFLLIDVDHFKDVNDTWGHDVGDRVLQRVAEAIQKQFRSDDYVCRIGGDEFAVLMTHTQPAHRKLVSTKLERINQELSVPGEGELPAVSLSAGVAHGSEAGTTADLFDHADKALYETKRRGRNGHTFHSDMPQ